MKIKNPVAIVGLLAAALDGFAMAQQQPIGTVGVQDATIAGALEVSDGRALLVGNTTVTARDRTAEIELKRGGTVKVVSRVIFMAGLLGSGVSQLGFVQNYS